ncbi:CBS domain-containing protein [Streptomyces anulatus]|uniref:hypothetical protein n=1 Tax=Streptomyces anulatus TaxID=1892 RepID=UPI00367E2CD5
MKELLAAELAEPYMTVAADDDAASALRMMARYRLPALLVTDGIGQLSAVLPCSQLVRALLPRGASDAVDRFDERHAERWRPELAGQRVAQWLPGGIVPVPVVDHSGSALEAGEAMFRAKSPLVVVTRAGAGSCDVFNVITAEKLHAYLTEADRH